MNEAGQLRISRCRDPEAIEPMLSTDFYDLPVCCFPLRLVRSAAKWLAHNDAVYFFVAESKEERAGYVFCHTLGPHLWRRFARANLHLLLYIVYAIIRKYTWRRQADLLSKYTHASPQCDPDRVSQLDLPSENIPFRWSPPDSRVAYIEMLYVSTRHRGQGIAASLLAVAASHMRCDGIRRLEAHIDGTNYSSLRAFLTAKWHIVRTTTMDFKASYDLTTER